MTELRAEAVDLIEKFPEESLEKVVNYLKNLIKTEDPFWNEKNISELERRIEDAKNGRNMTEHELIEVD